jgi:hypothetical protein
MINPAEQPRAKQWRDKEIKNGIMNDGRDNGLAVQNHRRSPLIAVARCADARNGWFRKATYPVNVWY